jgi:VWFA-related protein
MKFNKRYLPIAFVAVVVGFLILASYPPKWFAQGQDQPQSDQQPGSGPQPDVGETVLVPKKSQPAPSQPSTAQPAPSTQPGGRPEKINPNDVYTLSTSTSLVNVDVMVVDNSGSPLQNLGKKNFQLSDNGVPQSITNFGTSEAPMNVCLLVEFSNRYWPIVYLAVEYSWQFVQVIGPKDWVAVVDFDLKPTILTDFTQDRSEVQSAISQMRIPGFSEYNLYDALAYVLDRMKEVHGRKAIVAVVTGMDSFSKLTYDQILKIVKASDTPIYPVSVMEFLTERSPRGEGINALQAENALKTMASYSGGTAYFPRFEQEVPSDYEQIAQQLRMQYSLGFVPTNATKDGQYHKLKISVIDDQGNPLTIFNEKGKKVKYHIVARDGYYAPKS